MHKGVMTKKEAKERIGKLRQEIDHHRYLYHVLDKQEISEAALDSLKRELAELEGQWPELATRSSPTQRVGGRPLPEFTPVKHKMRMISLQDAFDKEDLMRWETRNKKIVPADYDYFVEHKIDGVSLSLIYRDGELLRGVTRGDGRVGEDVTQNIRTIEAIPLELRQPLAGEVEIRGEVYMLKRDFKEMNRQREAAGQKIFANPRNIAAGSIRQLDSNLTAARPLRFFAWEIAGGVKVDTREEEYAKLQELGFAVPPKARLFKDLDAVWEYLQGQDDKRQAARFLIDGAVIKINDLEVSSRLGIVGKAPRGSIAFKYAAEEATTVVEDIVVQVGRTGALTPVAQLKPVSVAGTVVTRATLHNADEIRRKDVRVGDTVIVRKAGDIIPEVVQVLLPLRPDGGSEPFTMPKKCPVCGQAVYRDQDGVVVRCSNKRCFWQQREKIIHALGSSGFDIEGLGEKIVEQLLQEGLIKDVPDVWSLREGDLTPLARFGAKSAHKLVTEIQAHKTINLTNFLVALSIPQVGGVTAADLAREFGTLEVLSRTTTERLREVNGIGNVVADAVVKFFSDDENKKLIDKYMKAGIKVFAGRNDGRLQGQTFVFTGGLENISRDEAKNVVVSLGGKVAAAIGAKVDFVVIGNDPGSKAAKAREMGIKILTPDEFVKMIKKIK